MSKFDVGDRVVTSYQAWAIQDGSTRPAYGRIAEKRPGGKSYVEFDMGAEGKLTLLIADEDMDLDQDNS